MAQNRRIVPVFFINTPVIPMSAHAILPAHCSCSEQTTRTDQEQKIKLEDLNYLENIHQRMLEKNLEPQEKISLAVFKSIIDIEQEFHAERLFKIFDRESNGYLTQDDIRSQFSALLKSCLCRKLKLLFDIYDADGNGEIDQEELKAIVSRSVTVNSLTFSNQQIDYLTEILFSKIDKDVNGIISFSELTDFLNTNPGLRADFEISISSFLRFSSTKSTSAESCFRSVKNCIPDFLRRSYTQLNPRQAFWGWLYVLSILVFFQYGFLAALSVKRNMIPTPCIYCYSTAKGFGKLLNWTSMLAVALMLKDTLTFLRNKPCGRFLPVDSAVYAHKLNGFIIVLCILGHVIMHFVTFGCQQWTKTAVMEGNSTNVTGSSMENLLFSFTWEIAAGWTCLVAAGIILIGSLPMVRRSGHFQLFFYSHVFGYVIFYVALLIHTQHHTFWIYICAPGTVFLVEKLYLSCVSCFSFRNKVAVREAIQWPSGVTMLRIERPPDFEYCPGDYILLKIPDLAWFEWHPFTLSSCPEDLNFLSVHIQSVGDWTRRLYELFKKGSNETQVPHSAPVGRKFNRRTRISILHKKRQSVKGCVLSTANTSVQIKGPYGTPTGKIFKAEHAVLICAGIGVTPFASILQSIVARHRSSVLQGGHSHELASLGNATRLSKVDFIWVVRNQRNLEWFIELLEELDAEQLEERFQKLLNISIYLTSATKMTDLNSFALSSALETFYHKFNRDLITGISARAKHGRPNWTAIFASITDNRQGEVSVFYCGPPQLGRELRQHCHICNFRFFKESF